MGIWVLIFTLGGSGLIGVVPGFVEHKYCKDAGETVAYMWENTLSKVKYVCVKQSMEHKYERYK